ncbi:cupin domain-containing protein [Halodesulfovibrio aestuarii]|uniref:Cupin domain-containing protein n=1 Tax=Halodesulfovibrio aestuarii TaxID=126333 RepID=A0ABV4JSQ0_9BACT
MKRVVCAEEVEKLVLQNQSAFYIDDNTILTPSAQDAAALAGIEIIRGAPQPCEPQKSVTDNGISSDLIYAALNALHEKGLLAKFLKELEQRFTAVMCGGGKVVRGDSIKMDPVQTCRNQSVTTGEVSSQEVIGKEDGRINSGFFKISQSCYEQTFACEANCCLLEGTLTVTINGEHVTVHAGDVMHIPAGADVVWETSETARIFYSRFSDSSKG